MNASSDVAADALALVERLSEDLARRWRRGERPLVEEYLDRHPELREAPEAALELLAEEIYLRQEAGQEADAPALARRFPQWHRQVQALLDCQEFLGGRPMPPRFPVAGEALGGFDLLAELGRGAHGRAFLARQPDLADRLVVLKVGPRVGEEHISLARLQHTHIVPLYSVHDFHARGLRGLCLPYFGGMTLAGLPPALPGRALLSRLQNSDCRLQIEHPSAICNLQSGNLQSKEGVACRFLAQASAVEAVCWLGACLADALHYAHERGLVHLDLKPSNVLLAADGQPMLLDFHLARAPLAVGAVAPPWLGGTPGYMAPEQQAALAAVADGRPLTVAVDGRADIYALGLLMGEMLGARSPAALRRTGLVTTGLADLLARCLALNPAERYPSAADLAADLRRHLADLPLRGVANRSLIERWRKWRRRRPATLPLLVLLLATLTAGGALTVYLMRQTSRAQTALHEGQDHLDKHHYAKALETFRHGATLAEDVPLGAALAQELHARVHLAERAQAARELHRFCERVRPLYGVDVLPEAQARTVAEQCRRLWEKRSQVRERLLDRPGPEIEGQVRADLLDLAILGAHLRVRLAPISEADAARNEALALLAQAEELFGPSCVLAQERLAHARALGLPAAAPEAAPPPRSAWEHCALGRAHFQAGNPRRALAEMDLALELQPQGLWPNFYKGCCAYRLGQFDDAVVSFSVCVVLAPDSAWCFYNRGLAYRELGRLDRAVADHDRALRLDATLAAAALSRGLLHYREKRYPQALTDLTSAVRNGLDTAEAHYNLALVHLAREDRAAALASARRALELAPEHHLARQLLLRLRRLT